ncbi:MAG: hypothetical protein J2P41_10765 [Blastocatellia bacterium]|nr:hypothetical protein [Blastocatellia bacterium]
MKKTFLLLLCLFVSAAAQTKANFAGTWVLDKSRSELPALMQHFEGVTWEIKQDDKELTREQVFQGGGMPGNVALTLKLDGSDVVTDAPMISGKRTATSHWQGDGKILEVTVVTTGSMQGREINAKTTEHWELDEGGKVLKVHQKSEGTRGNFESKLVFNKK